MPDTEVGGAFVDLFVKDEKFNSQMNKSGSRMAKFGKLAGKVAKGAAIAAGVALAAFTGFSLKALARQEEAEAQLAQVIRATGGAAGFSAEEMKKQAQELQNLTKFGDEAVIELQTLIATFRNIKGDEFKETTALALDMATLFGSTKAAAIQLGKALNDPIKGVSALAEVGITFSEVQKEQIKNFQEAGDLAKAQAVILSELENQFGGVAAASADTIGGRFEQVKNSLGDLGEAFLGVFVGTEGGLDDMLLRLRIGIDSMTAGMKTFAKAIEPVRDLFSEIFKGMKAVTAFVAKIVSGAGLKAAAKAFEDIRTGQSASDARFDEIKAASAAGLNKGGAAAVAGAGGGAAGAAASKPTFTGFAEAIKRTQGLQVAKVDKTKIDIAKKSLATENKMLAELETLNQNTADRPPIVTR